MFVSLAGFIHRRPWWTLVACTLFLTASIAMVVRGGTLTGGSFGDREAEQTQRLVEEVLGHSTDATFVAVFHSDTLDPGQQPFRDAMREALAPLATDPDVVAVLTPDHAPPLMAVEMVNAKTKSALAMITLKGNFKEA